MSTVRRFWNGVAWSDVGDATPVATGMQVVSAPRTSSTNASIAYSSVTPDATAHTKGAWAQLVASTSQAIDGITLLISSTTTGTTLANNILLDIGTGGSGSESVLVANIAVMFSTVASVAIFIPIRVASGTRIAARCQIGRASAAAISVAAMLHAYPSGSGLSSPTSIDTLGAVTASSSGVALSSNNTFTEVVASTVRDYRAFVVCPTSSDSVMSTSTVAFDIGIGGSGSEVPHLNDSFLNVLNTEQASTNGRGGLIEPPAIVPAGSRVAARVVDSQISGNAGWSVTLLGVPA